MKDKKLKKFIKNLKKTIKYDFDYLESLRCIKFQVCLIKENVKSLEKIKNEIQRKTD